MVCEYRHSIRYLFADDRSIYGILPDGRLYWYPGWQDLSAPLAVDSGMQVGVGWVISFMCSRRRRSYLRGHARGCAALVSRHCQGRHQRPERVNRVGSVIRQPNWARLGRVYLCVLGRQ